MMLQPVLSRLLSSDGCTSDLSPWSLFDQVAALSSDTGVEIERSCCSNARRLCAHCRPTRHCAFNRIDSGIEALRITGIRV